MKFLLSLFSAVILFIGSSNYCQAQYGASIGRTHPRGDFGKVFKPSTSFEFIYHFSDIDDQFRFSISIGFMRLNTVQDTFQVFASRSGGNGTILDSGYELYKNYFSIPIAFRNTYSFLESDLSPTVGLDFYIFLNDYYYEYNVPSIAAESNQGGSAFVGYQARVGLTYRISDEVNFDLDFGRTATSDQGDGKFTFWRTALSLNFFIN